MDPTYLFVSMAISSIGVGYFIYGKKQQRFMSMISGGAMGIYPFFVTGLWVMIGIAFVLMALPFVFDF